MMRENRLNSFKLGHHAAKGHGIHHRHDGGALAYMELG
jgi:hypothetical protein